MKPLWNSLETHFDLDLHQIPHTGKHQSSEHVCERGPPPPPSIWFTDHYLPPSLLVICCFFIIPLTNQPTHKHTGWKQNLDRSNDNLWLLGMGIENRFLFRTGSQWTDSLESLAKFFNDSVIDSLCVCACANLLIQTAANMLAFWITSDWGEWDWWWNNYSWEALLSFLSNTTVLVFRSSVSLGASG